VEFHKELKPAVEWDFEKTFPGDEFSILIKSLMGGSVIIDDENIVRPNIPENYLYHTDVIASFPRLSRYGLSVPSIKQRRMFFHISPDISWTMRYRGIRGIIARDPLAEAMKKHYGGFSYEKSGDYFMVEVDKNRSRRLGNELVAVDGAGNPVKREHPDTYLTNDAVSIRAIRTVYLIGKTTQDQNVKDINSSVVWVRRPDAVPGGMNRIVAEYHAFKQVPRHEGVRLIKAKG
jgi:hypothetical protein